MSTTQRSTRSSSKKEKTGSRVSKKTEKAKKTVKKPPKEPKKTPKKRASSKKYSTKKPQAAKKPKIAANLQAVVTRALANFKAPENLTVSQWADRYRKLSSENSAEAGSWKTSRTPYLKEIMDTFTDDSIDRLVVVASSQVGKTEAELNMLGYLIDQDPGPVMFVMPTVDNADEFSKRRLAPMIRDTAPIREKIKAARETRGAGSVLKKAFPGGMLTLTGSNSPASLASTPARYIFGDEIDRWSKDAGGEGDPWELLKARTTTFYNRKMVQVSTPTVKDHSAIVDAYNLGTQEKWCVQCPDCGEYHFIDFSSIRFDYETIEAAGKKQYIVSNAEYACPDCGCINSESVMRHQPMKWIAQSPKAAKNGCRSFWINAFTSPWIGWKTIVRRFLESKDDPKKLKTVTNTLFGQLWEERSDVGDENELASRAENYDSELPEGVLVLTCGVDVQADRLEYEVVGYGFHEENWGIQKGMIMGYPGEEETWMKLDAVIGHEWKYKNGKSAKISLTFVDSGYMTATVYEMCRERVRQHVFPIKGMNTHDAPFVAPPKKEKFTAAGGRIVQVWRYNIGSDAGKDHIYTGLKVQKPGPRYSHFPANPDTGYDTLFYMGLLSEHMVWKDSRWKWEKIPGRERNEALDCRNYANAAFKILHPNMDVLKQRLEGTEEIMRPRRKPGRRSYNAMGGML